MLSLGWWLSIACVAAGLSLGAKGLFLPLIGVPALWIEQDSTGAFLNHSGNGDNVAAIAMFGAIVLLVVCVVGVMLGAGLRLLTRRVREAYRSTP
jgi:hypothetical protein